MTKLASMCRRNVGKSLINSSCAKTFELEKCQVSLTTVYKIFHTEKL